MFGYTPPQPKLWKALVVCAPFVAAVAWSIQLFHVNVPTPVLVGGTVVAWLILSTAVHARVSNDWRAQYELDRDTKLYRTTHTAAHQTEKD
jgi:hypothetical protein